MSERIDLSALEEAANGHRGYDNRGEMRVPCGVLDGLLAELREAREALETIAGMTPDGAHALDTQLAPDMVRINQIARAALEPRP